MTMGTFDTLAKIRAKLNASPTEKDGSVAGIFVP